MINWVCFQYSYCDLLDVERAAADLAEKHVAGADGEFARQVAVGRAVVAAAAGLVEHQRAVLLLQMLDQVQGCLGGNDFFNHVLSPETNGAVARPGKCLTDQDD